MSAYPGVKNLSKRRKNASSKWPSTPKIALSLLVIGSTISSLVCVSFYFKSHLVLLTNDQHDHFEYGPPTKTIRFLVNHSRTKAARQRAHAGITTVANFTQTNTTSSTQEREPNSSIHIGCLSQTNSRPWLEANRLGNQNRNDSFGMGRGYVESSIVNTRLLFSNDEANSQTILQRTLCAKTSRFLNFKFSTVAQNGTKPSHPNANANIPDFIPSHRTVHQLALRLLYLSIHIHQHRHAIPEAEHRLQHPATCEREMKLHSVGDFDFECPSAKFLVVPMKHGGLGAQARLVAAPALMAGIASDRVVIFMNGSPVGPVFLREPWELSSCPRRDKQCFFLPDTPCVLTYNEIQNATNLENGDRRQLFKTGRVPDHLQDERVLVMNAISRPQRTPLNFRARVVEIAKEFIIDPLREQNPGDPRLSLLTAAANHILLEDEDIGDSFYYYGKNFQALHALVLYATRPKIEYLNKIDRTLDDIFGAIPDHRTDLALGLPIRASDKCIAESECPSFETYLALMQNMWETNILSSSSSSILPSNTSLAASPAHSTKIILTSESSDILKAQRNFQEGRNNASSRENQNHLSFQYEFVTNHPFDVFPNTGDPRTLSKNHESSMEDILLSAMTSLKMQFYAKYTAGNCCSNHHLLLFDFLKEGCGADDLDHVATCMQDHEDTRFRICCGWTKTEDCIAKRLAREALEAKAQQSSAS